MTSGKITFHASVDASGVTRCVVPSDDTGLTQAVEDCMRERVAKERYAPTRDRWTSTLPVLVSKGVLSAGGAPPGTPLIETIESQGLGEDVYDVIERLLPQLQSCVASARSSVVYVGAEVAKNGKVTCALASAHDPLPDAMRACVESTLGRATFKPPKKGAGLLAVPLQILGAKH